MIDGVAVPMYGIRRCARRRKRWCRAVRHRCEDLLMLILRHCNLNTVRIAGCGLETANSPPITAPKPGSRRKISGFSLKIEHSALNSGATRFNSRAIDATFLARLC